jgi:hypothetical protein
MTRLRPTAHHQPLPRIMLTTHITIDIALRIPRHMRTVSWSREEGVAVVDAVPALFSNCISIQSDGANEKIEDFLFSIRRLVVEIEGSLPTQKVNWFGVFSQPPSPAVPPLHFMAVTPLPPAVARRKRDNGREWHRIACSAGSLRVGQSIE